MEYKTNKIRWKEAIKKRFTPSPLVQKRSLVAIKNGMASLLLIQGIEMMSPNTANALSVPSGYSSANFRQTKKAPIEVPITIGIATLISCIAIFKK